MKANTLVPAAALCLCALLTACASKTGEQISQENRFVPTTESSQAEQYLALAREATNEQQRAQYFLEAATLMFANGLYAQAKFAQDSVDTAALSSNKLVDWQILNLELALATNENSRIDTTLPALNLDQALRTTLSRQQKIVRVVASAMSKSDQPLQAAVLLSDYAGVFGLSQTSNLNDEIWLLLQRSKTEDLTNFQYQGQNTNTAAWLELAKQVKLNQTSIDNQYQALANWLQQNADHPAAGALPLELDLLAKLPETAPSKLILALPLSGQFEKIGQAILEGFLASYYLYRENESELVIETFDTNRNDLTSLYENLSDEEVLTGKTLVIGPVTKSEVVELSNSGAISIPTLALNNAANVSYQSNLFLFGLDPEQELIQISKRVVEENLTRIAVIGPQSPRSARLLETLTSSLADKGGHIVSAQLYGEDQSVAQSVAALLATSKSTERSREISRAIGKRVESKPRRRKDIDALIMLADHDTAKQIKPLLAFNFAQDLPVYASSSIHAPGKADTNNDLSRVKFVDIPWVFTQSNPLRTQIESVRADESLQYARFYALGADAFLLAPRLNLLYEIPNSYAQGLTGKLSINASGEIERELQWARYSRGKPITIN